MWSLQNASHRCTPNWDFGHGGLIQAYMPIMTGACSMDLKKIIHVDLFQMRQIYILLFKDSYFWKSRKLSFQVKFPTLEVLESITTNKIQ